MHPLNDDLPGPYVPVRVTRGAMVAHRYTHVPPRCRTSQCRRTFVSLSVSLWDYLIPLERSLERPIILPLPPGGTKLTNICYANITKPLANILHSHEGIGILL